VGQLQYGLDHCTCCCPVLSEVLVVDPGVLHNGLGSSHVDGSSSSACDRWRESTEQIVEFGQHAESHEFEVQVAIRQHAQTGKGCDDRLRFVVDACSDEGLCTEGCPEDLSPRDAETYCLQCRESVQVRGERGGFMLQVRPERCVYPALVQVNAQAQVRTHTRHQVISAR
jgi:hypothetical protein